MSETAVDFAPLTGEAQRIVNRRLGQLATESYREYLAIPGDSEPLPGTLILLSELMGNARRSSYDLAAGSCLAEAALHPDGGFEQADRLALLQRAVTSWSTVLEREADSPNDLRERARWALAQRPTYHSVALFLHQTEPGLRAWKKQDGQFKHYFQSLVGHMENPQLRGHALEAMCSYFLHRSNKLRPNRLPLHAVPATVHDDFHPDATRRTDVDVYDLEQKLKFGIQVKAGKTPNPYESLDRQHRIFYNRAGKLLALPYGKRAVERTLKAISSADERFVLDLDTIAADHRARIVRYLQMPQHVGRRILPATVQGSSQLS